MGTAQASSMQNFTSTMHMNDTVALKMLNRQCREFYLNAQIFKQTIALTIAVNVIEQWTKACNFFVLLHNTVYTTVHCPLPVTKLF